MIGDGQVVDESFGAREIGIAYNLAMFTQVDEIDDDRHMKMYLDEFMDAIGRVADKLAVNSPYDGPTLEPEELSKLPTHIRLKNLIEVLMKATLRKDFVDFAEKKVLGIAMNGDAKVDPARAFKVYKNPAEKTQYGGFPKP